MSVKIYGSSQDYKQNSTKNYSHMDQTKLARLKGHWKFEGFKIQLNQ